MLECWPEAAEAEEQQQHSTTDTGTDNYHVYYSVTKQGYLGVGAALRKAVQPSGGEAEHSTGSRQHSASWSTD